MTNENIWPDFSGKGLTNTEHQGGVAQLVTANQKKLFCEMLSNTLEDILYLKRDEGGALDPDPVLDMRLKIRSWETKPVTLAEIKNALDIALNAFCYDRTKMASVVEKGFRLASEDKVEYQVVNRVSKYTVESKQKLADKVIEFFKKPQAFYKEGDEAYNRRIASRFSRLVESVEDFGLNVSAGDRASKEVFNQWLQYIPFEDVHAPFIEQMGKAFDEVMGAEKKPYIALNEQLKL